MKLHEVEIQILKKELVQTKDDEKKKSDELEKWTVSFDSLLLARILWTIMKKEKHINSIVFFFKKILEDVSPFRWATDTCDLDY